MNFTTDLIIITILIDIFLLLILFTQKLSNYEKIMIYGLFVVHILFYISLVKKYKQLQDICHIFYVLSIVILSLFVNNFYLLLLYILLIICMVSYWIIYKVCPVGKFSNISFTKQLFDTYPTLLFGVSESVTILIFIILMCKIQNKIN
tara:strand:+ start:3386 stop:3829 length:444 start_codon:yes stop_codon:yes gene_type:complete